MTEKILEVPALSFVERGKSEKIQKCSQYVVLNFAILDFFIHKMKLQEGIKKENLCRPLPYFYTYIPWNQHQLPNFCLYLGKGHILAFDSQRILLSISFSGLTNQQCIADRRSFHNLDRFRSLPIPNLKRDRDRILDPRFRGRSGSYDPAIPRSLNISDARSFHQA